MKNLMFFSFFALVFTGSLFPFNGNNDSLLFDGAVGNKKTSSYGNPLSCNILVTYSNGTTSGTKMIKEEFEICGQKEVINRTEAGQLKKGDILRIGDEISTGPDGNLEIELSDLSVIRLGPNSSIKIESDWCNSNNIPRILMKAGSLWTKVKKLLGGGKFEVVVEQRAVNGVRGTEFAVEIYSDKSITKVYEGSVETKLQMNKNNMADAGKEMEKITKDYQEGKITMQEYMDKVTKYSEEMSKVSNELSKSVLVNAGYMTTVTNKVFDPEPIPSDDDKWFENSKFFR